MVREAADLVLCLITVAPSLREDAESDILYSLCRFAFVPANGGFDRAFQVIGGHLAFLFAFVKFYLELGKNFPNFPQLLMGMGFDEVLDL